MTRGRGALFVAFGVDNFGSGLFLPLALVYATQVVGLSVGVAGTVVAAGTVVGLLVPPIAARMVDRVGPRAVVVIAQLLQACGALGYFFAHGVALVVAGAILLGAGQQLFYCALFTLIADLSHDGPKDKAFAGVGMVRSACFGLGSLAAGGLLTWAGSAGLPFAVAVAADAAIPAAPPRVCGCCDRRCRPGHRTAARSRVHDVDRDRHARRDGDELLHGR